AFAYGVVARAGNDDLDRVVAGLFWLGTAVFFGGWAYRFFLSQKGAASSQSHQDAIVAQCVPLPRQSPSSSDAFGALPAYCRSIIPKSLLSTIQSRQVVRR